MPPKPLGFCTSFTSCESLLCCQDGWEKSARALLYRLELSLCTTHHLRLLCWGRHGDASEPGRHPSPGPMEQDGMPQSGLHALSSLQWLCDCDASSNICQQPIMPALQTCRSGKSGVLPQLMMVSPDCAPRHCLRLFTT